MRNMMYPFALLQSPLWRPALCAILLAFLTACGGEDAPSDVTEAPDVEEPTVVAETVTPEPAVEPVAPDPDVAPVAPTDGEPVAYQVECDAGGRNCKVDTDTFIGWRMYNTNCLACHGPDAKGSSMAPNLMDRLNTRVDYDRFVEVMSNGYTGQMGAMPSFGKNPSVMDRLPSIYQYLKARADGALGEGRPERM